MRDEVVRDGEGGAAGKRRKAAPRKCGPKIRGAYLSRSEREKSLRWKKKSCERPTGRKGGLPLDCCALFFSDMVPVHYA